MIRKSCRIIFALSRVSLSKAIEVGGVIDLMRMVVVTKKPKNSLLLGEVCFRKKNCLQHYKWMS